MSIKSRSDVEAISLYEASKQALEALLDSMDDVRDCLNEALQHEGYAKYDRRIEAYREQIAKHEKAITDLRTAISECEGWDAYDAGYQAGFEAGIDAPCPDCSEAAEKQSAERVEPVAWVCSHYEEGVKNDVDYWQDEIDALPVGTPLYTTPPGGRQSEDCLTAAQRPVVEPHKWAGLTDEEIDDVIQDPEVAERSEHGWFVLPFALSRAIEAKLKEKNT